MPNVLMLIKMPVRNLFYSLDKSDQEISKLLQGQTEFAGYLEQQAANYLLELLNTSPTLGSWAECGSYCVLTLDKPTHSQKLWLIVAEMQQLQAFSSQYSKQSNS